MSSAKLAAGFRGFERNRLFPRAKIQLDRTAVNSCRRLRWRVRLFYLGRNGLRDFSIPSLLRLGDGHTDDDAFATWLDQEIGLERKVLFKW